MGQAKLKKKLKELGIAKADTFTIGIVATQWDAAPQYGLATALLTVAHSDINSAAYLSRSFSKGDLLKGLQEAFDANSQMTDQNTFAVIVMAYVAQTQTYMAAKATGATGMWLKLMSKGGRCRARPFSAGDADEYIDLMERLRKGELTDDEWMLFVYSEHPDDSDMVPPIIERDDKIVNLDGKTFTQTSFGTGKTSTVLTKISKTVH